MKKTSQWHGKHTVDIAAAPQAIWRRFSDVPGWRRWNAGIEEIEIDGPFETGTQFRMKPPGQDAFTSRLTDVTVNERFVDETCVGELVVTVTHELAPLSSGQTRVTYSLDVRGPEAEDIGPAISADFPEVLRALAADLANG